MENTDLISVVMSVYNEKSEWLNESIESILKQTHNNLEFIIVNDNPDNSDAKKVLSQFSIRDTRIKIVSNDTNLGLVKSLNKALKVCKGSYIARMDADDISFLNRLQTQLKFLKENPQYELIGGKAIYIDEFSNQIDRPNNIIIDEKKLLRTLGNRTGIMHPTWFFRRTLLDDKNIHEYKNVPYCEDYEFLTRVISLDYKVANINEVLIKYRIRSNGISLSNKYNQKKMTTYVSNVYKLKMKNKAVEINYKDIEKILDSDKGKAIFELQEKINNYIMTLPFSPKIKNVLSKFSKLINIYDYKMLFREMIIRLSK